MRLRPHAHAHAFAGTEMASLKKVYEVYETTQVYVL